MCVCVSLSLTKNRLIAVCLFADRGQHMHGYINVGVGQHQFCSWKKSKKWEFVEACTCAFRAVIVSWVLNGSKHCIFYWKKCDRMIFVSEYCSQSKNLCQDKLYMWEVRRWLLNYAKLWMLFVLLRSTYEETEYQRSRLSRHNMVYIEVWHLTCTCKLGCMFHN